MKEPDFKEAIVNTCKTYLSENLSDDEICRNILTYSADALDGIFGLGFNFSAVQNVLTFYLLNSKDCDDIKRENAASVNSFIAVAQSISRNNIQLGVLNKVIFDMAEQ